MSLIADWKKKITMAQAVLMHAGCKDTAKSLNDILEALSKDADSEGSVSDRDAQYIRELFGAGSTAGMRCYQIADRIEYMTAMSPLTREEFLEIKQGAEQGVNDLLNSTQDENVRLRGLNNNLISQVNALEARIKELEADARDQMSLANAEEYSRQMAGQIICEQMEQMTLEKSEKGSVV